VLVTGINRGILCFLWL